MIGSLVRVGALTDVYDVTYGQALAAALLAAFLLLVRTIGYTTTIAHEGGHALFGSFFGFRVRGVRFSSPGNAVTSFAGSVSWLGDVLTTLAGHFGPSLFGLLAAWLLSVGRPDAVLWIGLALLGLFLLLARNLRAVAATVAVGLVVVWALRSEDLGTRAFAALTWTWILLSGSVVDVIGLRVHRQNLKQRGLKDTDSDVALLRKATFIPASVWVFLMFVGSTVALLFGASLLLHLPLGVSRLTG